MQAQAAAILAATASTGGSGSSSATPRWRSSTSPSQIDARLIVVGTRKRGFGESIREFFTGSVAARLAHRQHRPILVVPLGEPVPDDEEIWPA